MSKKNSNNTSQLYIICGNKGGIGKSLVALTVAAVLEEKGRELIMVDTDKDNGSLIKPYANNTPVFATFFGAQSASVES